MTRRMPTSSRSGSGPITRGRKLAYAFPEIQADPTAHGFYTVDLVSREFVLIEAELRAQSPTTLIYVESGEWGERVAQADVDRMLVAFDERTPPGSEWSMPTTRSVTGCRVRSTQTAG